MSGLPPVLKEKGLPDPAPVMKLTSFCAMVIWFVYVDWARIRRS
jgi:hypothetical protein